MELVITMLIVIIDSRLSGKIVLNIYLIDKGDITAGIGCKVRRV